MGRVAFAALALSIATCATVAIDVAPVEAKGWRTRHRRSHYHAPTAEEIAAREKAAEEERKFQAGIVARLTPEQNRELGRRRGEYQRAMSDLQRLASDRDREIRELRREVDDRWPKGALIAATVIGAFLGFMATIIGIGLTSKES